MVKNIAYVAFMSPAANEWRAFGSDVLGAEVTDGPEGEIRLRVDDKAWRIAVEPGDRDDIAAVGWDVGDQATLDEIAARLESTGLRVSADDQLAAQRQVDSLVRFEDPFGFRHELVVGQHDGEPFEPGDQLIGEFVTGEQGAGHVVLIVPDIEAGDRFFVDVLGMRITDYIEQDGLSLRFYHCPGSAARHHTLALSAVPGMAGMHHFMLEVTDVDDVGRALDRAKAAGHPIAMDLGKHPNDQMTSFYVRTPSGFELEYGTGGVVVDDATWQTDTYDAISAWGHNPPADGALLPSILRPCEVTS